MPDYWQPLCNHFVDPTGDGHYEYLEDGEQEFDHDAEPSGEVHTGAEQGGEGQHRRRALLTCWLMRPLGQYGRGTIRLLRAIVPWPSPCRSPWLHGLQGAGRLGASNVHKGGR
jgi:hypothetical protein